MSAAHRAALQRIRARGARRQARSPPVSASALASSTPPARRTRADRRAASSSRSPVTTRPTSPWPARATPSARSRPRRRAATSRSWPSAAGERLRVHLGADVAARPRGPRRGAGPRPGLNRREPPPRASRPLRSLPPDLRRRGAHSARPGGDLRPGRIPRRPGRARAAGRLRPHALPDGADLPWQRVINARGEVSERATPGWAGYQRHLLEEEGVRFDARGRVDLARWRWDPDQEKPRRRPAGRPAPGRARSDHPRLDVRREVEAIGEALPPLGSAGARRRRQGLPQERARLPRPRHPRPAPRGPRVGPRARRARRERAAAAGRSAVAHSGLRAPRLRCRALVRRRAALLAETSSAQQILDFFEALLRRSRTWAFVDWIATQLVAPLLEADPRLLSRLDAWIEDPDFWIRRSALLALLPALRRGEGDWARFGRYADAQPRRARVLHSQGDRLGAARGGQEAAAAGHPVPRAAPRPCVRRHAARSGQVPAGAGPASANGTVAAALWRRSATAAVVGDCRGTEAAHAARHDRPGEDGRQHGAPPAARRPRLRRLGPRRQEHRGIDGRRGGRERRPRAIRRAAAAAPGGVDHGARRCADRIERRGPGRPAGARGHDPRRRQLAIHRRRAARRAARRARHRLPGRRRLGRRVGTGARLLPDGRRRDPARSSACGRSSRRSPRAAARSRRSPAASHSAATPRRASSTAALPAPATS